MHDDVFTIGIGGAAGDGVREAGQIVGTLLAELGYEVYVSFTYPSLIRGGHNFSRITFSKDKVWTDHEKIDVLISLNKETVELHKNELLSKSSVVFSDTKDNPWYVELPMKKTVREMNLPEIMRNSVALGALCYLLDLPINSMTSHLKNVFQNKQPDENIKLAETGYKYLENLKFRHFKKIPPGRENKEFIEGNAAFAKGLLSSGLQYYFGYPMTPSTGILHYLASKQRDFPLKVIQPENEIAVINMALGATYAGARTALASATGGFALMQEAFSFAGMAELPLAIAVSQRQAPATGVPTYSSQTDLQFVIHSGHGEFPRIVLLPGDIHEAFELGAKALNLAWKYQTPVIVLLDKILSENSGTFSYDKNKNEIEKGKISSSPDSTYKRYEDTEDGISPMAFPGTKDAVVKITSYEHDESGITTEEKDDVKKMINKRFRKEKTILKDFEKEETVKIFGDKKSDTVVIFWGSTKGVVLEAAKYLEKKPIFLQIILAEPFPVEEVRAVLLGAKKIINIEQNHNAQMAALIREKTGIEVTENILKYDSRPFEVEWIWKELGDRI